MKIQRTITIDTEIDDKLKQNPTINASALINLLLKKYFEEKRR